MASSGAQETERFRKEAQNALTNDIEFGGGFEFFHTLYRWGGQMLLSSDGNGWLAVIRKGEDVGLAPGDTADEALQDGLNALLMRMQERWVS